MIINMNGAKAPETPSPVLQEKTVTPETLPTVIGPDEGYDGLTQVTVNPDAQLKAENIRSGKTIFGVTGAFVGEPTYSDDIDISAIGGVSTSHPIYVPVIGSYEIRPGDVLGVPRWYGVLMTFTSDKPPAGSPSFDWSDNYCFSYPTDGTYYVITEFNGMGNLGTYIGNNGYAPVEINVPEGDYPANMSYVTPSLRNGTVELINAKMSYGSTVSNSEDISSTPTISLYATNDSFEIPNQTITVSKGIGMVHLPAIHTTGYVMTYYGSGEYYVLVSVNIYGTMKVTKS